MAVDTSALRVALVQDGAFIGRLQSLLAKIAFSVLAENSGGNLAARQAFARRVMTDATATANRVAPYIIFTDNFVNQTITITPEGGGRFVTSIATVDADAESQISTKWDALAALFT